MQARLHLTSIGCYFLCRSVAIAGGYSLCTLENLNMLTSQSPVMTWMS